MVTLAVSTWHANPALLHEQISNYNIAFDGDIVHMVNINSNFISKFWSDASTKGIDFRKFDNLHFVEIPKATYGAGVAHAFFYAVQEALKRRIDFEYIYWHTSADLLVRRGINKFIRKFDVGFSKSIGQRLEYKTECIGVELVVLPDAVESVAVTSICKDPYIASALRAMGGDRLYKSRSEGSFFARDIFFELMYPLVSNISIREMYNPQNPYPIEEYLFAQCVEFFCERNNVRRTEHVILTSKNERQRVTIKEIDEVLARGNKFGVKRFDNNLLSPERDYIRKLIST